MFLTPYFSPLYQAILKAELLQDTFYNLLNNTLSREVFKSIHNKSGENTILGRVGNTIVPFYKCHIEGKTHIVQGQYYIPCNVIGKPEFCLDITQDTISMTVYCAKVSRLSQEFNEVCKNSNMIKVKVNSIFFTNESDAVEYKSWLEEYRRLSSLIAQKQLELEELNQAILEIPFEEVLPFGATTPIEVRALKEAYSEVKNNSDYSDSMFKDSYQRYLQIEKEKEETLVLI